MTASRIPAVAAPPELWKISPVVDYEPAALPLGSRAQRCAAPTGVALHRTPQHSRPAHRPPASETAPPRSAVVFAEAVLRQVIEVIDRRRPVTQLRALMPPVLIDCVLARAAAPRTGSATLRRVRVRSVDTGSGAAADDGVTAAEVFASFTRSGRVHAIAARIVRHQDSWRVAALDIG
ncbi:Rv3235 family protein [Mycobacterium sp. smrl_JER01]|uniref:Rv3235 family protein n=1 Tax=Mycobacterium sp. smrl_JER01 TaxID=3402633 RepID=UPI003AC14BB2